MNELFESSYLSIMSGKCEEYRKEIERLTAESTEWESKFYDLQEENKTKEKENIYLDSEIGRLNNIINELENILKMMINHGYYDTPNGDYEGTVVQGFMATGENSEFGVRAKFILDKLKELKESGNK